MTFRSDRLPSYLKGYFGRGNGPLAFPLDPRGTTGSSRDSGRLDTNSGTMGFVTRTKILCIPVTRGTSGWTGTNEPTSFCECHPRGPSTTETYGVPLQRGGKLVSTRFPELDPGPMSNRGDFPISLIPELPRRRSWRIRFSRVTVRSRDVSTGHRDR